jgi:OmpA-OmpF porin, OOP family
MRIDLQGITMKRTTSHTPIFTVPAATALAIALVAGFTAVSASAQDAQLAPQDARMTDGVIDTDYRTYEAQQAAIKAVNDTGLHPVKSYSLSKAQCWLDVSFHEYTRNDRSDFPQAALSESHKITTYLAGGGDVASMQNPANQTPLVNDAAKLRPDLWARADALKQHAGFRCAEQLVACGEVELVHAGNEHNQQQWRHAKPYVQIAEDLLGQAQVAADACGKPAAPQRVVERINLSASALFRFNRRAQNDLLPVGKAELDQLADRIRQVYASVERIDLVGYTDRLGSDRYNAQLSQDRADTVKAYLQARGIDAQISATGRGEADPVVQCEGERASPTLTDCLQPNRRVEVTIVGVKR